MTEKWKLIEGRIIDMETRMDFDSFMEIVPILNGQSIHLQELRKENEYLKKRLKETLDELYCKDRVLEEKGIPVECCDKNE